MGAWLERHFAWHGETSRDEYRRWLPLIVAVDAALLWALHQFGTRGMINFSDFGWAGVFLFIALLPYFIGWLFLTGRRLRAAGISRGWLIFAVLTINVQVLGVYIDLTLVAFLLLTTVAALARDSVEQAIA